MHLGPLSVNLAVCSYTSAVHSRAQLLACTSYVFFVVVYVEHMDWLILQPQLLCLLLESDKYDCSRKCCVMPSRAITCTADCPTVCRCSCCSAAWCSVADAYCAPVLFAWQPSLLIQCVCRVSSTRMMVINERAARLHVCFASH